MDPALLTTDTQAALLLTAPLGKGTNAISPLTPSEYAAVAVALQGEGRRPGDLLAADARSVIAEIVGRLDPRSARTVESDRLQRLIERGGRLALAMSRWSSAGVWVLGRADAAYPSRYKQKFGRAAPPIVYGIGPQSALEAGGLAVVGSRDPDAQSESVARDAGKWAAGVGVQIVSGAARGVDALSMVACSECGGSALGVVADSLLKLSTRREFREQIVDERMTLISSFDPDAGFRGWMAMARNRWVYALADRALVVAATDGSGGTWEGAIEAIKSGARVYVVLGNPERPGNDALAARGAIPAPDDLNALWRDERGIASAIVAQPALSMLPQEHDVYVAALPLMLHALKDVMTAKRFGELTGLTKSQADMWLGRLVDEGRAERIGTQYRVVEERSDQLSLLSE